MTEAERHKALDEMSDEDIDYSDIPPLDEEFFRTAKRVENPLYREEKRVKIKPKVLDWFRENAEEENFEALINDVLENYMEEHGGGKV